MNYSIFGIHNYKNVYEIKEIMEGEIKELMERYYNCPYKLRSPKSVLFDSPPNERIMCGGIAHLSACFEQLCKPCNHYVMNAEIKDLQEIDQKSP